MLKFKQLDEISQGLRDKYVAKATAAHGHYNMARRNTTGADQQYFARKEKNTQKGISRALDDKRLNKESSDMCNVCGQTPCNCTSIIEAAKDDMRATVIKRAIARAQRKAPATVNEIKMSDDEYKNNVDSYGKRATNLLKHSWSQHDVSKEKVKAGDKEGAAKASATGSRAHKLFLKAKAKHLSNPETAERERKKVMSGASDYYASKKPGEYTGDSFDPTLTNSNPYIQEGLVDESSDKLYAGYQADVLSLKAKAAAQEKKRPVDIQKLAARLKAADTKSQGTK